MIAREPHVRVPLFTTPTETHTLSARACVRWAPPIEVPGGVRTRPACLLGLPPRALRATVAFSFFYSILRGQRPSPLWHCRESSRVSLACVRPPPRPWKIRAAGARDEWMCWDGLLHLACVSFGLCGRERRGIVGRGGGRGQTCDIRDCPW